MSVKINKNNKEYPLGFMPEHYPADRVYLDGDLSKTVQDFIKVKLVYSASPSTGFDETVTLPKGTYILFLRANPVSASAAIDFTLKKDNITVALQAAPAGTPLSMTIPLLVTNSSSEFKIQSSANIAADYRYNGCHIVKLYSEVINESI